MVAKLPYNYKYPSVRPSICPSENENMIFIAPIPNFLLKIPLTNEHLFYNYFVRLYVGNTYTTYSRIRPFV